MKKLLIGLFVLFSVTGYSQQKQIWGNGKTDIKTFIYSLLNNTDSVFRAASNGVKIFKPLAYTDGNQAAGKVLTSDANGNATWQPLGAAFFPWDFASRDSATTSNAVATTIATINIDNDTRGIIEVRFEAINATQGLTGIKRVRWKKIGSTLTLGTVEDEMATERDGGLTTAGLTITTSSNNIIIQGTGEASTTLDWKVTYFVNQKIAPL